MSVSQTSAVERPWCVVRTHHRQEQRASDNLRSAGIETFLPCLRPFARRRRSTAFEPEPLFPQYIFVRVSDQASVHNLQFTRGVQQPVRFGSEIALVSHEVIEFLKARTDGDGFIAARPFQRGEAVSIHEGPFQALTGVVDRYLPGQQRVMILLTAAEHMRVDVPVDWLSRC